MDKFNYEESLKMLENTVSKLEKGGLSLDEMMKLYEQGVSISAQCSKALDEAELKITEMSRKGSNNE